MKKFIIFLLFFLLVSCSTGIKDEVVEVPSKTNESGLDVVDSSINTLNLDKYLDCDDVFYCDLRYYSWILKFGYIKGFKFIPYYNFLACKTESHNNALFRQKSNGDVPSGTVGSFEPIYVESINILKKLFPQDKKIFFISQSGLESYYASALLVQYGYDAKNIYNIGGVSIQCGPYPAYIHCGKNFVEGNKFIPTDPNGSLYQIDLVKLNLTLIKK